MDVKHLLRIRDWVLTGNHEWRIIKRSGRVARARLYYEQVDLNRGDRQVTRWIRGNKNPDCYRDDELLLKNFPENGPDRFKTPERSWF